MISKSASRRNRRIQMKNPTWQERMLHQRNLGRKHTASRIVAELGPEIVRRETARAARKPLQDPKTKKFLPIVSLRKQYERAKAFLGLAGNGQQRPVTA